MISDSPNPKLEAEALAKADADLRAALARAPNLALAHRGLAYVATLKKNWPAALAAADKAVALEPDGSAGYCRRGRVHGEAKEYAKALADIAEGLKRDANDADCYFHRAYAVWDLQERWADSVADYSKAIALDPDDYYSLNNRAWAYMKMGQSPKGLPDAQKAIQLAPRWAEARDTAGHILEAMGKKAEAIAEYRQALALDPKHQGAKDGLARLGAKP